MNKETDKVWVTYTLYGKWDDPEMVEERRFRNELLGEGYWSSQSVVADKRTHVLVMDKDTATLFKLKFKGVIIEEYDVNVAIQEDCRINKD